jgi:hypothetical protein
MRTWMRLVPTLLLILPSAPALLQAADPEIAVKKEDFQKLLDKVDKLQNDMTANSLRGNRTEEELRLLREELRKIRELLERMAAAQGATQRQAGFGPSSPSSNTSRLATPTTGTILLQNVYSAPATVRINGQSYFVDANQTREVRNVPVGPFQYSVDVVGYGTVQSRTDNLPPAGYRITIFPLIP